MPPVVTTSSTQFRNTTLTKTGSPHSSHSTRPQVQHYTAVPPSYQTCATSVSPSPSAVPAPKQPGTAPGISLQELYPTPPPSPDLDTEQQDLKEVSEKDKPVLQEDYTTITTVPIVLTPEELPSETFEEALPIRSTSPPPQVSIPFPSSSPAIPIAFLLNTAHPLPHAAPFRLAEPSGILSILGGNRILRLEGNASVMDRMPYSAASTSSNVGPMTKDQKEEESVEAMLGGPSSPTGSETEGKLKMSLSGVNGLQWSVSGSKLNEHPSSIFVHPPTPEREEVPNSGSTDKSDSASSSVPNSRHASPRTSPRGSPMGSPRPNHRTAMHVLPEVRSPPRRNLEIAADSLKIAQRRGRRPRLFGFTEMPESSDSANSSRASSRNVSPEREMESTSPSVSATSSPMGPAASSPGNFIPRRHPIRARSETALSHTIHSIHSHSHSHAHSHPHNLSHSSSDAPGSPSHSGRTSPSLSPTHSPTLASGLHHVLHHHPRRRENGLKLDFTGIVPLSTPTEVQSAIVHSPYSAKLIRKKSGEILKPALKYGGPLAANGTPLYAPERPDADSTITASRARFESKSAPTTPSCPKYVHFDAQLERVKLFQKDQKPQVVSTNASPTAEYTTSEGEEYPFPSTDEEGDKDKDKRVLQIKLPNFPTSHPPETDMYLESLFLDDDRKSLRGLIQVKNLAFQKWVAVRFTFDWWQTTSEVTASFKDSVKAGTYDRFTFTVKLHDLLTKIEEKTLFMAIRYNTDGKEIWDSNGGQNYQVLFEKVAPAPAKQVGVRTQPSIQPGMGRAIGGRTSQWSVTSGHEDDRLADLRAKLNSLKADDISISPPQVSPISSRHTSFSPSKKPKAIFDVSPSASPRRSFSAFDATSSNTDLPIASGALAARYDFGSAWKGTKERRQSNSPSIRTTDLPDVRTGLLSFGSTTGTAPTNGGGNGSLSTTASTTTRAHGPGMEFYSPRLSPNSMPSGLPNSDGFFSPDAAANAASASSPAKRGNSPPTHPSLSATQTGASDLSRTTVAKANGSANGFLSRNGHAVSIDSSPVPDLHIQGPSPETTPEEEIPTPTTRTHKNSPSLSPASASSPKRPGMTRSATSPAVLPDALPSPLPVPVSTLAESESASLSGDTVASDSPKSPALSHESSPRWSPTSKSAGREGNVADLTNYSSFIEQFCWGGAPALNPSYPSQAPMPASSTHFSARPGLERRAHSTSDLETYFNHGHPQSSPQSHSPFAQTHQHSLSQSSAYSPSGNGTPRGRPHSSSFVSGSSGGYFSFASPSESEMARSPSSSSYYSAYSNLSTPTQEGGQREGMHTPGVSGSGGLLVNGNGNSSGNVNGNGGRTLGVDLNLVNVGMGIGGRGTASPPIAAGV